MEHTSNYELSKWAESDRIMMEDFNMDNDKIDAALAGFAASGLTVKTGTFSGELTGSVEGSVKWMTLDEMLSGKLAPNMTKYLAVFQNENIPQAYGISGKGLNLVDNNSNLIDGEENAL